MTNYINIIGNVIEVGRIIQNNVNCDSGLRTKIDDVIKEAVKKDFIEIDISKPPMPIILMFSTMAPQILEVL